MWKVLRNRQTIGVKFRRQHPLGRYIVDFVCLQQRLVIEIDGGQHAGSKADERRDAALKLAGYTVMRFWNNEVLSNMEGVVTTIAERLRS